MFLAWRDVLHAKGRFAIITTVVTLMTLLVGFLTGLTGGLAGANVDTVQSWKADRMVMSAPTGGQEASMSTSRITSEAQQRWEEEAGKDAVTPVAVEQLSLTRDDVTTGAALIAGGPGAGTGPDQSKDASAPEADQITLSEEAAETLGASKGSKVSVAGQDLTVSEVTGTGNYSHVPVAGISWDTWDALSKMSGGDGEPSALLVHDEVSDEAAESINDDVDTISPAGLEQLLSVGSFRSEVGSLGLMIGLLMAISALVVGAFFTVWTLQRTKDIAVIRALGAPVGALLRDAVGQALLVLVVGVGLGVGIVAALGPVISSAVPFVTSWLTTVVPGALMALLGLVGAAFALRSVTKADPMSALA